MKLKAKVSFAGRTVSAGMGQEFNCPDDVAEDLIRAGYAEKVVQDEGKSDNHDGNSGTVKGRRRVPK